MKRAILAALVAASVGVPPSVGATEPPGIIQPGTQYCIRPLPMDERPCGTLGFVLRTRDERLYFTIAAHGADKDNRIYTGYADDEDGGGPYPYGSSDGFGTVVIDDDSFGDEDYKTGADVALVEIDRVKRHYVSPSVKHWTGPSGVLGEGEVGYRVYTHGVKPDQTYGPQEGHLLTWNRHNFNSTLQLREGFGTSGSPYLYAANGGALGLNGNCLCGTGVIGYPTVDYAIGRFRDVPDYESLQLVTARYQPPPPSS